MPTTLVPTTTRLLARALVLAALAGPVSVLGLTVTTGPAAYAAPQRACSPLEVTMQARQAQAVFTGEVTAVRTQGLPAGRRGVELVHDVAVEEVYKAARVTVPAELQVLTTRNVAGECDLGRLSVGEQVVFFVRAPETGSAGDEGAESGEEVPVFVATGDSGTAVADADYLAEVEEILPNPVPPVPASPTAAEFEALPVDPPTPLGRAAAPGAALVVIGLLGLFVVRRLNRR